MLSTLAAAVCSGCGGHAAGAAVGGAELVRVNQVGYVTGEPKTARLLSAHADPHARFSVLDAGGAVALSGSVGRDLGRWSATFPHVYSIDLSALRAPGRYVVSVSGRSPARSPAFTVGSAQDLYTPVLAGVLRYLRAQRDGPDVDPSILGRGPSHLADAAAQLYATPRYRKGILRGGLHRVGGPVDVAGGWMDAGDTLKFAETASFTETLLASAALREPAAFGAALPQANAEARHGLDWLLKLWDPKRSRLIYQVGLGDGNGRSILGAHDTTWRLPETDDRLRAAPGSPEHFVKYRPAFVTGPAISPNLAGRMAAAYATGAQLFAADDPPYAARLLGAARSIFARARTRHVGQLVTSVPHAFYPELEWRDDLELGAVSIAEALRALGAGDGGAYLRKAVHWAGAYARSPLNGSDSLNLYDVAALAHERLAAALKVAGAPATGTGSPAKLGHDLVGQLSLGAGYARRDPFGLGWAYRDDDVVAHALGLSVEGPIVGGLTGKGTWAVLARVQRDLVLGENAWGTTFVVGAGSVFPHCLHDPVANLSGSLDGTAPLMLGAVVPGPVAAGELSNLQLPRGFRACPVGGGDRFARFAGAGARYADRVADSPTVEPSIDLAGLAILAFARQASP